MELTPSHIGRLVFTGVLVLLTANLGLAQSQQKRVFVHESSRDEGIRSDGLVAPNWSGGALLVVDHNISDGPLIYRIGRDGARERIAFSIPHGHHITIFGLVGGKDGSLVVAGTAYSDDGQRSGFVANVAADHKDRIIAQLASYCPHAVTIAPDGSLWTAGWILTDDNQIFKPNIIRCFDRAGKLLREFVPRAKPARPWSGDATAQSVLKASKDRVVWLTNGNEYLEFALDGRVIDRFDGPPFPGDPNTYFLNMAVGAENEIVVGAAGPGPYGIYRLDRNKRTWDPIEVAGAELPTTTRALGFDGDALVVSGSRGVVARFRLLKDDGDANSHAR